MGLYGFFFDADLLEHPPQVGAGRLRGRRRPMKTRYPPPLPRPKFKIAGEVVNDRSNVLVAATDNGGTKRLKADEPMTRKRRADDGPRTDRDAPMTNRDGLRTGQ